MYGAFAATAFQTRLAYRGQVWARALGEFVEVSAKVAIWSAVYGGIASVDGVTLADMITYAIIGASVTSAWHWDRFVRSLGEQVKSGDVAVFLLKPLRYPMMLFSSECGNLAFSLVSVVLPIALLAALLYGFAPPASFGHLALFILFWALGFLILFLLATLTGLLGFWMMTTFSLEWTLLALLTILSGRMIPLWFFPPEVAAVLNVLPFAWIGFHPTAVYLGQTDIGHAFVLLGLGAGWVAALGLAVALLWSRTTRRLVVQGG